MKNILVFTVIIFISSCGSNLLIKPDKIPVDFNNNGIVFGRIEYYTNGILFTNEFVNGYRITIDPDFIWNSIYHATEKYSLKTDKDGYFACALPAGEYYFNSITFNIDMLGDSENNLLLSQSASQIKEYGYLLIDNQLEADYIIAHGLEEADRFKFSVESNKTLYLGSMVFDLRFYITNNEDFVSAYNGTNGTANPDDLIHGYKSLGFNLLKVPFEGGVAYIPTWDYSEFNKNFLKEDNFAKFYEYTHKKNSQVHLETRANKYTSLYIETADKWNTAQDIFKKWYGDDCVPQKRILLKEIQTKSDK